MLSDDEKNRIRLEETFRHECRNQLATARRDSSRTWTFLNSALGLWLLSAIFISGAGSLITHWQQQHAEQLQVNDAIGKLDLEISYRFSQVLLRLYELTDQNNPRASLLAKHSASDVQVVLQLLRESPSKTIPPLYPEYERFGIPSLIAELRRHTYDQRLREMLEGRLADITGRRAEYGNLSDVNDRAGTIIEDLMLSRWKNGAFHFTDCTKAAPFC